MPVLGEAEYFLMFIGICVWVINQFPYVKEMVDRPMPIMDKVCLCKNPKLKNTSDVWTGTHFAAFFMLGACFDFKWRYLAYGVGWELTEYMAGLEFWCDILWNSAGLFTGVLTRKVGENIDV